MGFFVNIMLSVGILGAFSLAASDWSYEGSTGPSHWKDNYENCGRTSQSPINIDSCNAMVDDGLGEFSKDTFSSVPGSMKLLNNGHTAQINILEGGYTISDSKLLPADYKLAQFHLHWGSSSTTGSEHTLGGTQYFGELHAVFYNTKYDDIGAAIAEADGLAVLGFFIDIGSETNDNFKKILDILDEVPNKDNEFNLANRFALSDLMPSDISKFYRYSGSLTTPACYESVTWTVFHHPIMISKAQADLLSSSLRIGGADSAKIVNNFRPVQGLNGRKVHTNSSVGQHVMCSGLSVIMLIVSYVIYA